MAREDVYIPQFEPAAADYNKDNIDRNFNEVRDIVERLRSSTSSSSDEASEDLTALEGTVTTISEAVYSPTTGLAETRARIITEEGVRATADTALASRATTLEATVNDGTTGLVATRARLVTEESTRATADTALASRSTTLEARSYVKGNLVKGSRPNYDSSNPNNLFSRFGWQNQGLWTVNYSDVLDGPFLSQNLTSATSYTSLTLNTNAVSVSQGVAVSAQAMLAKLGTWGSGTLGISIYWYSDPGGTILVSGATNGVVQSWENGLVIPGQNSASRWVSTPNQIAPTGAQSCRLGIYTTTPTIVTRASSTVVTRSGLIVSGRAYGNGVYVEGAAWMLKLEYGTTCTAWTDEAINLEIDARVRTEESARASADSALASRSTTLEATVNNATTGVAATAARLTTEESARASADSALASRSTTLEAQMANTSASGLQARISTEESARVSADSALASRSTTLEAQMANTSGSGLQSRISTEETTRASADSTLASRSTTLESQMANTSGSGLQSRISTEETTRASADSTLASRSTTLESQMANTSGSGLQSRISTEETTRASADSALATRATNLEATVNDGTTGVTATAARLTTEESTRASADSALATRATNLEATVNNGTTGVTATAARLTTEETTRASADSALATRATNLEATVNNGTTGVTATAARLTTEETTRASADSALASRSTTLEAQMANTSASGLQSRISTEETTRASADSTLASRSTTLESQMANTSASGLQSRISTEETTRASADSALATRSTTLESVVRFPVPEALNKNPTFATWSGASGTLPEDWADWSNGYTNTKATGDLSPNAYRQSNAAGAGNYGIYHLLNGRMTQGNYVLEADVTLNSGSLNGAALYCQWGVSSITVDDKIQFTVDLDVSGSAPGAGVVGRRYRFSKMINVNNTAELFGLYIMTNADGFATSGNAKDLTWHKALVRPATQGEIDAKVAKDTTIPTTIARIATEETTRASADSALAARSTTLESQIANTSASGLQSRIATEETTRASADSTLASRATTLESQIANTSASGLQSRIATEESTRASADSTQASQITTLTAQANGNPNLFPYPTPITNRTPTQLGWTGTAISSIFAAFVGGLVYYKARGSGGSAVNEAYVYDLPEEFYFQTTSSYTLSCYGYAGTGAVNDRVYAYLEFRSADNLTLLHTSTSVTLNSISTRQSLTGTFPGASTAGKLRVVFLREWPSSGAYQDVVFNMIKVEAGTVATAFTNSAQVIVQSNAVATLNDSAAFYQILVAASGGDPAIVRLFSGLGGSEVAIAAKIISLINTSSGVSMPVMRAQDGEAYFSRPISSDFGGRRLTIGPGYGVTGSKIVLWFGPDSIAPDSQSRTNGYFALGSDGVIYYGSDSLLNAVSTYFTGSISGNVSIPHDTWTNVIEVEVDPIPAGSTVLISPSCLVDPVDGVESYIDVRVVDTNTSTVLRAYSNMLKPIFSAGAYRAVADALVSFSFTTAQAAAGATYQLQVKSRTPSNTSLTANVKTRDLTVLVLKK